MSNEWRSAGKRKVGGQMRTGHIKGSGKSYQFKSTKNHRSSKKPGKCGLAALVLVGGLTTIVGGAIAGVVTVVSSVL